MLTDDANMTTETQETKIFDQADTQSAVSFDKPFVALLWAFGISYMSTPLAYCICLCTTPLKYTFAQRCVLATGLYCLCIMAFLILVESAVFYFLGDSIKRNWLRTLCSVPCAIAFPIIGPFFLGYHCFKRRLWTSLLLIVGAVLSLCGIVAAAATHRNWYYQYHIVVNLCLYILTALALLAAIGHKKRKLVLLSFLPPLVGMIAATTLLLQFKNLQRSNQQLRQRIEEKVGYSISQYEFMKRMESGSSIDTSPLKELLQYKDNPDLRRMTMSEAICLTDIAKRRQVLQEFLKKNPDYPEVVHSFASLPPKRIAHRLDWQHENAYSILLPELSALRNAAHFLAWEMASGENDKELVQRNNAEIISLRETLVSGNSLICKTVSMAIEATRMQTLCLALPQCSFTEEEWNYLLGDRIDWNKHVIESLADELCHFENAKSFLLNNVGKAGQLLGKNTLPILPLGFMRMLFEIDNNLTLEYKVRMIDYVCAEVHPYEEIEKNVSEIEVLRKGAILTALFTPDAGRLIKKADGLKDLRRLAWLAWHVNNYYRINGAFPPSLETLSADVLDTIYQKPFILETGFITVQIPFNDPGEEEETKYNGFRIYAWDKKREEQCGQGAYIKIDVPMPTN